MSTAILQEVFAAAAARGLTQKQLAASAGIREETLSRLKKHGSPRLSVVEDLARAAGVELVVRSRSGGAAPAVSPPPSEAPRFRERYRTLLWSNPKAPDEVLLRRALVRPTFRMLLDAAVEFGPETLRREWEGLLACEDPEVRRVRPATEQLLRNIRDGFALAAA